MRVLPQRETGAGAMRAEAALVARLDELFAELPLLVGFVVRTDMTLGEVEMLGRPGARPERAVEQAITAALLDVAIEVDDTGELFRGRTFARALQ